jgi:predicted nucleic acid-binding protein
MIVFFDTSVHVAMLRGQLAAGDLGWARPHTLRMSPVVAHELLRGARTQRTRRAVERLVAALLPLEPPSWRLAWLEAARLLRAVFAGHEEVGLTRLQNDCLLALTAHLTGAALLTRDRHFQVLAGKKSFTVQMV